MSKLKWLVVILLNLIIAVGFYIDGTKATIGHISSDLANIIPVCIKLDDPSKFKDDLYLNDINNVKYYTPAFVETLRLCAGLFGNDYLKGLNFLGGVTHFLYGILWFLFFFTLRRDFWLSLLFSIFFRGIIWPPGGELFGISDLWTIMPRTVFITLAPIPFLLYYYLNRYRILFAALSLGLILNFHPISGIGLAACYFAFYFSYKYLQGKSTKIQLFYDFSIASLAFIVGMLPYLLTYFLNVKSTSFDQRLYDLAFHKRLGYTFSDPIIFIAEWHRPILYFFLILFILFYIYDRSKKKIIFKSLAFSVIFVFLTANLSVYLEEIVNYIFGMNLRLSFQLIRYQKFILLLFQIGTFLLMVDLFNYYRISTQVKILSVSLLLIVSSLSFVSPFSSLPIIGDDLVSSILPNNLMVEKRIDYNIKSDLSDIITYIRNNTEVDAVFYGSFFIRAGAERSVILDGKGASMIIEGNQPQFIRWYEQNKVLNNLDSPDKKIDYLRNLGADYILSADEYPLPLVKKEGSLILYKI